MVREVEPGVEDEEVDESLKEEFEQPELVLPACPVSVERHLFVKFPHPNGRVD